MIAKIVPKSRKGEFAGGAANMNEKQRNQWINTFLKQEQEKEDQIFKLVLLHNPVYSTDHFIYKCDFLTPVFSKKVQGSLMECDFQFQSMRFRFLIPQQQQQQQQQRKCYKVQKQIYQECCEKASATVIMMTTDHYDTNRILKEFLCMYQHDRFLRHHPLIFFFLHEDPRILDFLQNLDKCFSTFYFPSLLGLLIAEYLAYPLHGFSEPDKKLFMQTFQNQLKNHTASYYIGHGTCEKALDFIYTSWKNIILRQTLSSRGIL